MEAVALGLASFPGIGRRLERKGEARGVVVYDDYGHHPTAIRVTIEALRQREPGRRIWAVYEPLTFHRTAALLGAFADALVGADAVVIADIWASRDSDTTITSPAALVAAVWERRPDIVAAAPGSVEATAAWLATHVAARRRRAGHGWRAELPDRRIAARGAPKLLIAERAEQAYWRPTATADPVWAACRAEPGRQQTVSGEVSFDVVSEFDAMELRNALDQVRREAGQRYDFRGATVDLQQGKDEVVLVTDDEFRAAAIKDLILSKAVRRGLSLKVFDWGTVEPAGGSKVRQKIGLREGLPEELAKRITKIIRDEFPKVKSQIQGDAVRVSGKSKDDLQRVIARLRGLDEVVELQFQNYR